MQSKIFSLPFGGVILLADKRMISLAEGKWMIQPFKCASCGYFFKLGDHYHTRRRPNQNRKSRFYCIPCAKKVGLVEEVAQSEIGEATLKLLCIRCSASYELPSQPTTNDESYYCPACRGKPALTTVSSAPNQPTNQPISLIDNQSINQSTNRSAS